MQIRKLPPIKPDKYEQTQFVSAQQIVQTSNFIFRGGDFGWIAVVKPQQQLPLTDLELTWIFIRFKGFTQCPQYIKMSSKMLLHTNFHLHPLTARRMSHLSGIICITCCGSAIYYCFQLWKTGQKTQHLALFLECGCVTVYECAHMPWTIVIHRSQFIFFAQQHTLAMQLTAFNGNKGSAASPPAHINAQSKMVAQAFVKNSTCSLQFSCLWVRNEKKKDRK